MAYSVTALMKQDYAARRNAAEQEVRRVLSGQVSPRTRLGVSSPKLSFHHEISQLGLSIVRKDEQETLSLLDSGQRFSPRSHGKSIPYLAVASDASQKVLKKIAARPDLCEAINDPGDDGQYLPLHHMGAFPLQDLESTLGRMKLLMEAKADVNVSTKNGQTVLHKVSCSDRFALPMAQMLLRRGAEINAVDKMGFMPLDMHAAHFQQAIALPFISFLVANGADASAAIEATYPLARPQMASAILEGQRTRFLTIHTLASGILGVPDIAQIVAEY